MVCEKGSMTPEKPCTICSNEATKVVVSTSKKSRVLSVGIYSNDENPIRKESDCCTITSFFKYKETESTGIWGIVSNTNHKFATNLQFFFVIFCKRWFPCFKILQTINHFIGRINYLPHFAIIVMEKFFTDHFVKHRK